MSTKSPLPKGWIIKISKSYPDKIYYFNPVTKESTWELPKSDQSPTIISNSCKSDVDEKSFDVPSEMLNLSKSNSLITNTSKMLFTTSSNDFKPENSKRISSFSAENQPSEKFSGWEAKQNDSVSEKYTSRIKRLDEIEKKMLESLKKKLNDAVELSNKQVNENSKNVLTPGEKNQSPNSVFPKNSVNFTSLDSLQRQFPSESAFSCNELKQLNTKDQLDSNTKKQFSSIKLISKKPKINSWNVFKPKANESLSNTNLSCKKTFPKDTKTNKQDPKNIFPYPTVKIVDSEFSSAKDKQSSKITFPFDKTILETENKDAYPDLIKSKNSLDSCSFIEPKLTEENSFGLKKSLSNIKFSFKLNESLTPKSQTDEQNPKKLCNLVKNESTIKHLPKIFKSITPPTAVVAPVSVKRIQNERPDKMYKRLKPSHNKKSEMINNLTIGCNFHASKTSFDNPVVTDSVFTNDSNLSHLMEEESSSNFKSPMGDTIEDIEMLDVSSDLTKIDDLPSILEVANENSSYYIVIDTNVFIGHLRHFNEIKDVPIGNCGPPHIFIPWVVIQELDNLRKTPKLFKDAQNAIKYVNKMIKSKHPRFKVQSPKEVIDWAQPYSQCNDDLLLECCTSLAEKMPRQKVILVTNDINLLNKALILEIQCHDFNSLMKFLKIEYKPQNLNKKEKKKKKKVTTVSTEDLSSVELSKNDQKDLIQSKMLVARNLLKAVLENFLEKEMHLAYGDCWKAFKIDTSLLESILKTIEKYWRTVFSFNFSDKDKRNFEFLQDIASRPEGFQCEKEECLTILTVIEDIFCRIKRRWPDLSIPTEEVQQIRASCNQVLPETSVKGKPNEIINATSNYEIVLGAFEYNWRAINQLCGMIMDFYGLPHMLSYDKPDTFPSEAEFDRLMCKLYPGVQKLKECMSRVVNKDTKLPPIKKLYKKFYDILKNFVPSLQINAKPYDMSNFNAAELEKFCSFVENKEKIAMGYQQLENFCIKLEEVVAMMPRKDTNIMTCE